MGEPGQDQIVEMRSFPGFYEDNYRNVLALAFVLSGSWAAAEDLAQEAFGRAWEDWGRVSEFPRADTWVRTVAVNLARSRLRRLRSQLRARLRLQGERLEADIDSPAVEYEHIWEALRALPTRQAEATALYYVDGRPVADVARVMGVAEGTVKALLYQARQRLGEVLTREDMR